jgi:hypothetical protein
MIKSSIYNLQVNIYKFKFSSSNLKGTTSYLQVKSYKFNFYELQIQILSFSL